MCSLLYFIRNLVFNDLEQDLPESVEITSSIRTSSEQDKPREEEISSSATQRKDEDRVVMGLQKSLVVKKVAKEEISSSVTQRKDEDRVVMGLQKSLVIKKVAKKKEKLPGLVDLIFAWSISDIMNKDLFKDKVMRIPVEFTSVEQYSKLFINPLIEETHADLLSKMTTLSHAPSCEVLDVISDMRAEGSAYKLELGTGEYEPVVGDLIALTEVRPRCIDDLDRPRRPYLVALVEGMDDEDGIIVPVVCSKPLVFEKKFRATQKLFAVHLTNLTTNLRIWKALHPDLEGGNLKLINTVLKSNPSVEEHCTLCSSNKDESINLKQSRDVINPLRLDKSQKDAVLSSIATIECRHENKVKLIWGPPGTGKTKTIATLLFALFKMKFRTLTCAPTNVAVLGVTKRLMSLLNGTLLYETYGLGDIILLGNGERMKIDDDHEDLSNVYLDHRVYVLAHCFAPLTGWKGSLESMIRLLDDPENQYSLYLRKERDANQENTDMCDGDEFSMAEGSRSLGDQERKHWNKKSIDDKKERRKRKPRAKTGSRTDRYSDEKPGSHRTANPAWTFEEYVIRTFRKLGKELMLCIIGMCTHMPTSYLSVEVLTDMIKVHATLQNLCSLLNNFDAPEDLRQALKGNWTRSASKQLTMFCQIRSKCSEELKHLRSTFSVPKFFEHHLIRSFCLKNASLIFCTASTSSKLQAVGMGPIELVIIDEAAQLKECESWIPLQLSGIRHAILVGDEKQLPAMVQSKFCDKADFGRSLFERLVILKQSKQLLNVQYRMHPTISFFPNKKFYGRRIKNGQNVMERAYERRFLKGKMFGSYSFINIHYGKEDFDDSHSRKNMVEVSVVAEIVSKLFDEHTHTKQKVSVGCISPYKAQVRAIQERLGSTYSADVNAMFSVNVRSVDGFQGGEEDVIIFSTVRCNGSGSVGFLSDFQRTNVALTRARYCLWILGNGATLLNSGTVWKELVVDAKQRRKFFNAYDDKGLALAIGNSLVDLNQLDLLFCTESILFRTSKWKVVFSAQFQESMPRLQQLGVHKDVSALLVKLSNGWRHQMDNKRLDNMECASLQLLEIYDVKKPLKLIWTVHILTEKNKHTQVIKIWDVLPGSEIPKLAKTLDIMVGNNTTPDYVNRCSCKRVAGNMTLPVTWPVDANPATSRRKRIVI